MPISRKPKLILCLATDAQSAELDEAAADPVIIYMPEISKTHLGGTMRLGLRSTFFQPHTEWSLVRQLYGNSEIIWERHRHRYEVNPEWVYRIEKHGLSFTGRDERGERMQVAELKGELLMPYINSLNSLHDRSSVLRRHASAPRILHTTAQSVTRLPRLCCRFLRHS